MKCTHHSSSASSPRPAPLILEHVGDGPWSTILSFCALTDVARLSCTNHYVRQLCHQEYQWRDARMPTNVKSAAPTAGLRLQQWAVATACASRAVHAKPRTRLPRHAFLQPLPHQVLLQLYSASQQAVVWQGFLPCCRFINNNDPSDNQQQQQPGETTTTTTTTTTPSGWQLDVQALAPVWAKLLQSRQQKARGRITAWEHLAQLVEDLTIAIVHVQNDPQKNNDNSQQSAALVTCTQGVALCQRPNVPVAPGSGGAAIPTTFVLRQQWIANTPVVVHLSIRAYGHVLDQMQVSYFCVR